MFISEFRIWITSAHERYSAAKKLIEDSKNDPPSHPYRSKYEAREILNQLVSDIEKQWTLCGNTQVNLLYALFHYEIGMIALETEETTAGCDALNISWDSIKDVADTTEGSHLALKTLNQLGILWSERGEIEKALEYLLKAEGIYNSYKSSHEKCPLDSEDMFMLENDADRIWAPFEKTFTHTLYYLAQVYELDDQNDKTASYCRETLKRQRESGDFETNDWAINCATLSQFYIKERLFQEARHLLCSASIAANTREDELNEKEVDEEKDVWGEFHQTKASISCYWVKYSISVLQESHTNPKSRSDRLDKVHEIVRLTHDKDVLNMEGQIPTYVSSFEEARSIFLFAVNHIAEAKLHYTLNQYANNYVQIVQDHSVLYKCLSYYESDVSRQCKMLKRRIDMLEAVLQKLNPQYYLSVCRQLQFELGEIYFEIMDTKQKVVIFETKTLSPNAAKKINSLITNGIDHFTSFIKSLQDKDGKLPDAFSEDNVRPALIAYFYLGRFHSKLIESDTNRQLHNLSKAEEYYKLIVNYVDKNQDHLSYIEKELPVAKEMIELMPERMAQVTGATLF